MKKYLIKGYGDYERGLKDKTQTIAANTKGEAWDIAFKTFPEYKEVGVWEEDD